MAESSEAMSPLPDGFRYIAPRIRERVELPSFLVRCDVVQHFLEWDVSLVSYSCRNEYSEFQ